MNTMSSIHQTASSTSPTWHVVGDLHWIGDEVVVLGHDGRTQDAYAWQPGAPVQKIMTDVKHICKINQNEVNFLLHHQIYRYNIKSKEIISRNQIELARSQGQYFSETYCRYIDIPNNLKGHIWLPFPEKKSFLDFGTVNSRDEGVFLITEGGNKKKIDIPFPKDHLPSLVSAAYNPKKFFLRYAIANPKIKEIWRSEDSIPFWFISSIGEAAIVKVKWFDWMENAVTIRILPVATGFIAVNNSQERPTDQNGPGIYMISGTSSFKIVSGHIEDVSVSDTGLSIAFVSQDGPGGNYDKTPIEKRRLLKSINLAKIN